MSSSLNPSIDRLQRAQRVSAATIRIFRSSKDEALCHELVDGHQAVLNAYGIEQLITFDRQWIGDPEVLVLAAVAGREGRVLGGARMYRGVEPADLPMFRAVAHQDAGLASFLSPYLAEGAYELGGLWNSMELAGMGVDATYLIQGAMATLPMLSARHIFALTSPVTRRMQAGLGFLTESQVGDEGFFVYPTPKLRATIARFTFPEQLADAQPSVRALLEGIWQDPLRSTCVLQGPKGEIQLHFQIDLD
jgi:hypothetical protein